MKVARSVAGTRIGRCSAGRFRNLLASAIVDPGAAIGVVVSFPSPAYAISCTGQGRELSVGYSERWVGSIRRLITLPMTRRHNASGMIPRKGLPSGVPRTSGPTHANSLRWFHTIRERSSSPRWAATRGGIGMVNAGS